MHRTGGALFLCLALFIAGAALSAQEQTGSRDGQIALSLPEARSLAIEAAQEGQPQLSLRLSEALLKATPDDPMLHYLIAAAHGAMGQPRKGQRAAARAFRLSDNALARFQAAELAARLSYADNRPTMTQLWLRRAVQNAPNEQVERQLASDYARVRAENPLSFNLRVGLRPSNNVNDGADSALQIIDGIPFTGRLSGAAQALSGMIFTTDASLGYRLRGTDRSRTVLGGRLYLQRVALSQEARNLAPEVSDSDFGYTYGELALDHAFAIGSNGGSGRIGLSAGQLWYGGDLSYDFIRLSGGRSWRLSPRTRLSLDGSVEQRLNAIASTYDTTQYEVAGGVTHELANGNGVGLSLNLREITSDFDNGRYRSAAVRATYEFAKLVGPARITAGLTVSHTDYPKYLAVFEVPGGRQDQSVYADLTLFFPDYDYAGFAPTVRVNTGRSTSNISRFDTRELSVSLGIESKF